MPILFSDVDESSWIIFVSMLASLAFAAFLGKFTWKKRIKDDSQNDDELKIVLGATLSLFGLLIGFILSFAISGYNTRLAAEENEAVTIGNAFQRTSLLTETQQAKAEGILQQYLHLRIQFFNQTDETRRAKLRMDAIHMQNRMWAEISKIAKAKPDSVIATVLNASNDLYTAQQKTLSSWRRQIPNAAWGILILFGLCSNFLIGYNIRGKSGSNILILTIPTITALALFMIAEIDAPGRGIIRVTPTNLEALTVQVPELRNTQPNTLVP